MLYFHTQGSLEETRRLQELTGGHTSQVPAGILCQWLALTLGCYYASAYDSDGVGKVGHAAHLSGVDEVVGVVRELEGVLLGGVVSGRVGAGAGADDDLSSEELDALIVAPANSEDR